MYCSFFPFVNLLILQSHSFFRCQRLEFGAIYSYSLGDLFKKGLPTSQMPIGNFCFEWPKFNCCFFFWFIDWSGQQQIIKILPNNSGQQLKAITKNVIRLPSSAHQVTSVSAARRGSSIKVTPQQMVRFEWIVWLRNEFTKTVNFDILQTALKLGNHNQNTRIVQIGSDAGSHNSHPKTVSSTNISHNSHGIKKDT